MLWPVKADLAKERRDHLILWLAIVMVTDISLLGQLLGNFRSAEWPLLGTCRAAWLLLAWLACGGMAAFAADTPYTIREKPFHAGEYDLLQDGKRLGTVRKRPFLSGELEVLDQQGRRQETIRKNPFLRDQYDIIEDGHPAGTVRQSPFTPGLYELRDPKGRKTGQLRKDPFNDDQWQLDVE